jgi:hypothetical protein
MAPRQLGIQQLASEYAAGLITPSALITELYPSLAGCSGVFIHLLPLQQLLERCAELEAQPVASRGKLWGVPFAVKDNVDVAGMPTTAACPAFSYTPTSSSPAVDQLLTAGACGASPRLQQPPGPHLLAVVLTCHSWCASLGPGRMCSLQQPQFHHNAARACTTNSQP